MFASTVTMNGLRVTIASIIEITEFLLRKDDPYEYVLTGKLNQDLIEVSIIKKSAIVSKFDFLEIFGLIRSAGGGCEKPRTSSFLHLYRLLSCYYMSRSALQGNVDGTESLELLSSFKKMYEEKGKLTKLKRSTCEISFWTELLKRLTTA